MTSATAQTGWFAATKHAWRRFWEQPLRAEPLAAFRIVAAGALICHVLLTIAPDLSRFYLDGGLTDLGRAESVAQDSGRALRIPLPDSLGGLWALLLIWVASLFAVMVGWRTRFFAVLAYLLTYAFNWRNIWVLNGADDLAMHITFYLALTPAAATWSVDALRAARGRVVDPAQGFESPAARPRPAGVTIAPWSVRLLQIHIVAIYLVTGLSKFDGLGGDWVTGEALYWILNDHSLSRISYEMFPIPMWLCKVFTWATIAWELSLFALLLWPKSRLWALRFGFLLHLGIWVSMDVGWFSLLMLAFYPVLMAPETLKRWAARLSKTRMDGLYLVAYDTFCPICRRSRVMLERLDLGARLSFIDLHDREMMATHFPGVPYALALGEMQVKTPNGVVTSGYFAFRSLTRILPALRPIRYGFYLPGVVQMGRIVYRWVAQNRYRLVNCDTEICNLHVRALSQANIDEKEIAAIVERARQEASV